MNDSSLVHVNCFMKRIEFCKMDSKILDRGSEASTRSIGKRFKENSKFPNRVATMDEIWVHFYYPETKQRSMD